MMLRDVGLRKVWKEQDCNKSRCEEFKRLLMCNYAEYCMKNINCVISNPKMRTYRLFKCKFSMEPYLLMITDFKIRRQLCRFRLSNHKLHIEKGRHTKPKTPVESRLCTLCKTDQIEDEFHFLCVCSKYDDLREEFFKRITSLGFYGNYFRLYDIFNFEEGCFMLGKLLCKMFERRKELCIL